MKNEKKRKGDNGKVGKDGGEVPKGIATVIYQDPLISFHVN